MVRPKKQSKRVPVRLRHKIEKKVSAKAKKNRKLAKKDPTWKTRLKKDPGIPNLFPYKEKVLEEIEMQRRSKEVEKLRQKELARGKKPKELEQGEDEMRDVEEAELGEELEGESESGSEAESGSGDEDDGEMEVEDEDPKASGRSAMAALLASARERAAEFEGSDDDDDDQDEDGDVNLMNQRAPSSRADSSLKSFSKHFQSVISSSDVILYVLDARDPYGTRSQSIEQQIRADDLGSKRLVLLLNKIDLVPTHVLKSWLVYLRRFFPTLPIRASKPASGAKTFDHHSKDLTGPATARTLVNALKSYAKSKQLKRAVTVGVVGFPNVGKSSVINAILSRGGAVGTAGATTACPVGAEAGVTTSIREVKLDSKLKLLDSPGIVFPSNTPATSKSRRKNLSNGSLHVSAADETAASLTLLNALPPKLMPNSTVPAVSLLLSRLKENPELFAQLTSYYSLPPLITAATQKDLTMDFLVQVARKKGRLGKGGVPNIESAAKAVVTDWRDGRISGWTEAPVIAIEGYASTEVDPGSKGAQNGEKMKDQKDIVQEWATEFKIDGLWGDGEGEDAESDNEMAE